MKIIKKYAGILWILIGLVAGYFNIVVMGIPKFESGKQEDLVFAIINVCILTPIIVGGLFTFGYYALSGDYNDNNN